MVSIMKAMKCIFNLSLLLIIAQVVCLGQIQFVGEITPRSVPPAADFQTITVSPFGDIYLLEQKRCEIYRLKEDGSVINVFGGYGWGIGQFDQPMDLNMTSGLDLLVADYNNHRVVRFDRNLNYLATYPDPSGDIQISYPRSVALSNLGEVFILNDENSEIIRLNVNEATIMTFGGVEYGPYALKEPRLIRLSSSGLVTVLEKNGRILQFDRYGTPCLITSVPIESAAISFTMIGEDLLVFIKKEPYVFRYFAHQKKWAPVSLVGFEKSRRFISVGFRNERLYLLDSKGKILLCSIDKPAE
jgi:hypothetical protein